MRADRLEQHGSFEGLRAEWNDLASATRNVFATWEWASVWWRHFGAGRTLHLTTCRAPDGRLVAILPLYVAAVGPIRVVRLVGDGPGDQLGPICRSADREDAAACLRTALAGLRADVFLGEHLLREDGWSALLGGHVLRTEGSPVVELRAASWDELMAGWSANQRQKIRRNERKLMRERGLRYRLGGGDGRLDADLDTLLALHRMRFPTSAYGGADVGFHRDFAAVAHERGWLRLWILEADGRPRAGWLGFRFAGVESSYQSGRDPSWQGPGVGTILYAHTVRAALEDGMREYRFLRGGEEYKYHLASRDPGLETIALATSPLGRAALATGRLLPKRITNILRPKPAA